MPPKAKFTKEEIIEAALSIVRVKGFPDLTARSLGNALGSSTRPVFTVFQGMEEVQREVIRAARQVYNGYIQNALSDQRAYKQQFKSVGAQYILFSIKEPKLFQLLFMREQENLPDFTGILPLIDKNYESYLTPERTKPIIARKLGTGFDKTAALAVFAENAARAAQIGKGRQEYPDSITARLQRHKAAINAPKTDTVQGMVDIQKKLSEGKGKGYEKTANYVRWAKIHNLKQAAKTVNFLSEHGFTSPEELEAALAEAAATLDTSGNGLKELE